MTARARFTAFAAGLPPAPGRVTLATQGPIARITLDNPGARNAMTAAMMVQLIDAVDALAAWPGAVVILASSTPGMFCAGGDLAQVRAGLGDPAVGHDMAIAMGEALDALLDLPCVSIAAIDGKAIGGGAELVTACDLRVMGPDAQLDFVHVRLGVAPGWGGAARLTRLLGRNAAIQILGEAHAIDGPTAKRWGLADHVTDGPALPAALDLARRYDAPPEAVRAVKRQVVAANLPPAQAREEDAAAFASVWGGPAHRAALATVPAGRGQPR